MIWVRRLQKKKEENAAAAATTIDENPAAMETPWYAAFPAAKTTAPSVSGSEVLGWLQDDTRGTVDFVLVDLRRTDYEVGIHPSLDRIPQYLRCMYTSISMQRNHREELPHQVQSQASLPPKRLIRDELAGRHDSWIHQPASSEFVSNHSNALRHLQASWRCEGCLVLWFVFPLAGPLLSSPFSPKLDLSSSCTYVEHDQP